MNMRHAFYLGLISICVINGAQAQASMASSHYTITVNVLSNGGGAASSTSYESNTTLAQPSPIGNFHSANFSVYAGFWNCFAMNRLLGDITGDGNVDLEDAVTALKIVADIAVPEVRLGGDVNRDRRIGTTEAIYILQAVGEMR